ncbi:CPBP family intramembrane glutamic endopeptidase [Blastococcus tunisiensis]|uniref:Membrane protease YdiL, CAAX protease family n=1 Tax=Blastococcus tunisiensis TaxID=1798228 RepID=A0A1I2IK55_9ACTN|nr:type II CAAX endopeptidase family protein [Blastococcus sp. DSM 46838]SFF42772.1 Membrane protease YdiL, CAAX protease family [Blastococcus sp. DSM 46838]
MSATRSAGVRTAASARPLLTFVLLAYGISWLLWAPAVLGVGGPAGTVLLAAGAFGPAVAAGLVVRWSGGSVRGWLQPLLRWRVPARYWVYALGLPVALFLSVNVVLALLGEQVHLDRLGAAAGSWIGTFVVVALVGGGQEEPGWRGFALDRLQARHSPLAATALLALIWGLWHLPIYGIGFVGPMLFAVFYTWLWNRTGSLLLCVALHGAFTPSLDHLVLVDDSLVVDASILGVLVLAAVALVVLTRGRLGFDHRPVPVADQAADAGRIAGR